MRHHDKVIPYVHFPFALNAAITFGIKPVLVDVEPDTGNIDLDKAEKILKKDHTISGIVPVDIAGHSVDIKRVYELLNDYDLKIVEDACPNSSKTMSLSGIFLNAFIAKMAFLRTLKPPSKRHFRNTGNP